MISFENACTVLAKTSMIPNIYDASVVGDEDQISKTSALNKQVYLWYSWKKHKTGLDLLQTKTFWFFFFDIFAFFRFFFRSSCWFFWFFCLFWVFSSFWDKLVEKKKAFVGGALAPFAWSLFIAITSLSLGSGGGGGCVWWVTGL